MNTDLLYRLSDWNPQLFRELKGRIKPRNITLTLTVSVVTQSIILLLFYSQLINSNGLISWQQWWMYIFQLFIWILPLTLIVVGVALLIGDLAEEERRGTLNFLRLSPQSSHNILLGKLLGVPVLIYFGVGLAIPLHWVSAIYAGIPLSFMCSFYLLMAAACCFFYSLALLFVFMGGFQGWVGGFFSFILLLFGQGLLFSNLDWQHLTYYYWLQNWRWYTLPVGANNLSLSAFMIFNLGFWTYWIWQGLNHRFHNPNATIISKKQSYLLVASFELWLLGFFVVGNFYYEGINGEEIPSDFLIFLGFIIMVNWSWFLVLIAALSPHRQTLQDWSRYRHNLNHKRVYSLIQDLMFGEKSPAPVAIGINLIIAAVIGVAFIFNWQMFDQKNVGVLFGLLLSLNLFFIYGIIVQIILLSKSTKRSFWAAITVGTAIISPMMIVSIFGLTTDKTTFLWLFTPFFWMGLGSISTSSYIFIGFLGQLAIETLLCLQLTRKLRQIGASTSKPLLTQAR